MKLSLLTAFLSLSLNLFAPVYKTIPIEEKSEINPFSGLWRATCQIESSFKHDAVGDKHLKSFSYGIAQIRKSRIDDFNKRTGNKFTISDVLDSTKSRIVFMHYASQYNHWELERISRQWNGGTKAMQKKSTKIYWKKIKANL